MVIWLDPPMFVQKTWPPSHHKVNTQWAYTHNKYITLLLHWLLLHPQSFFRTIPKELSDVSSCGSHTISLLLFRLLDGTVDASNYKDRGDREGMTWPESRTGYKSLSYTVGTLTNRAARTPTVCSPDWDWLPSHTCAHVQTYLPKFSRLCITQAEFPSAPVSHHAFKHLIESKWGRNIWVMKFHPTAALQWGCNGGAWC